MLCGLGFKVLGLALCAAEPATFVSKDFGACLNAFRKIYAIRPRRAQTAIQKPGSKPYEA